MFDDWGRLVARPEIEMWREIGTALDRALATGDAGLP